MSSCHNDHRDDCGNDQCANLVEPGRVMALVKASLNDIKPNSYIGVTAMPQADGSQRAVAIHIFTEAMRGTGEGHRPWDLRPGSTMTNAAVETSVVGVDGHTLMVKYKDGDKKVIVPPDTPIVSYTRRATRTSSNPVRRSSSSAPPSKRTVR